MQGAMLKDPKKILVQQTKNVQSARQIRFKNMDEILKNSTAIKSYIDEAIACDNTGLKFERKKTDEYEIHPEFQNVLNNMPEVNTAFKSLTPGRQRAYLLYFSAPKQVKTVEARIEKSIPKILEGKGLDD